MNEVYLLIGGNMGDREALLAAARESIAKDCGFVRKVSSVYETAAWGLTDQPSFLNQALLIETKLSPQALLSAALGIEEKLGRKRQEKYGPRLIDIDILFYNDDVIQEAGLTVPHPHMQKRRFVLTPLQEIAPHKLHPLLHRSVTALLKACPDALPVHKFS